MSFARRSLARAAAPLACLVAGCNFDALGLGSTTELDLPGTTTSSTGDTGGIDDSGSGSTGEPAGTTTGEVPTTDGSSSGDSCPEGCPPTEAWTVTADGIGAALVVDANGDVIVAGEIVQVGEPTYRDAWLIKYTGVDGGLAWEQRHVGSQKRSDFARSLALESDGTIVAVGGSREDQDRRLDVWVGWFDNVDGASVAWGNLSTGHWNGNDAKLDEWAEGVVITAEGDLVVGGTRCPANCEVPDGWIGRFAGTGKPMWQEPMLSVGQGGVRDVLLQAGGLVAVGTDGYEESMAPWRSVVRRFGGDGAGTWSALPEASGEGVGFEALTAAVGPDGALWVVGREFDPIGGFVRLYMPDVDDQPLFEAHTEQLGGKPAAITVAQDGSIVLAGATGDGVARHLWFAGFTAELGRQWVVEEPVDVAREARGVVRDHSGALLVLGLRDVEGGSASWLGKYALPPA